MKKIILPFSMFLFFFGSSLFFYSACDSKKGERVPTAATTAAVTGGAGGTGTTSTPGTGGTTGTTGGSTARVISISTKGSGYIIGKNSSLAISATITDSSGNPVEGDVVNFTIDNSAIASLTPNEAGSTSTYSVKTDATGIAAANVYSGVRPGKVVVYAAAANATSQQLALFLSWITITPTTGTVTFGAACYPVIIEQFYVTGNAGTVSWTNVRTDLVTLQEVEAGNFLRRRAVTTAACAGWTGFGDTIFATDESGNHATSTIAVTATPP